MNEQSHIQRNYDIRAMDNNQNALKRQQGRLFEIKSFNNWIKSVLLQIYTQQMCKKVERQLDLRKGNSYNKILHVLDIGCGRGQDIKKWRLCRVSYMLANDFSSECIKEYERRWNSLNQPYKLYLIAEDFTKPNLYYQIQHSYYDIVSAQFCFHYMFGSQEGLKTGLSSILSNLLIDGVFIATIPDSYTILKKINQKGQKQEDGSIVYGNRYFSIRFRENKFTHPYGNVYQFYLEEAVGEKNQQTGEIQYVEEWLVPLDNLQTLLKQNGVVIQSTMNFLEFYLKYREQYKHLFSRLGLNFELGKGMDPDQWQIGHLYRVLVCRKVEKGKRIAEFGLSERKRAARKQIERTHQVPERERTRSRHESQRGNSHHHHSHHNSHHSHHKNPHSHHSHDKHRRGRQ